MLLDMLKAEDLCRARVRESEDEVRLPLFPYYTL